MFWSQCLLATLWSFFGSPCCLGTLGPISAQPLLVPARYRFVLVSSFALCRWHQLDSCCGVGCSTNLINKFQNYTINKPSSLLPPPPPKALPNPMGPLPAKNPNLAQGRGPRPPPSPMGPPDLTEHWLCGPTGHLLCPTEPSPLSPVKFLGKYDRWSNSISLLAKGKRTSSPPPPPAVLYLPHLSSIPNPNYTHIVPHPKTKKNPSIAIHMNYPIAALCGDGSSAVKEESGGPELLRNSWGPKPKPNQPNTPCKPRTQN